MTLATETEAPIALNDRWRVTSDNMQWIIQRRRRRGTWEGVVFCQTRAGLMANIGYEVFGIGAVGRHALTRLESLPKHRYLAPACQASQDAPAHLESLRAIAACANLSPADSAA
jgi:hypothetical protein